MKACAPLNSCQVPAPDHHQLALDVAGPRQAVVGIALAELMVVDVGRVEAGSGAHIGVHAGTKGKVSAEADAHDTQLPRAIGVGGEPVERGPRVAVERRYLLSEFEIVASVGARLIVGEHGARLLELVIDLRRDNEKSIAGQKRRHSPAR